MTTKTFATALLIGLTTIAWAQNEASPQPLTYEQANDVSIASNYSNGDEISSYTLSDGSVLSKGSELLFGSPINNSKTYTRILFGYYSLAKALMATPQPMPSSWQGSSLVVDRITVQHKKMSKNSPLNIFVYAQDPNLSSALGANNRTIIDIEMAISTGEVVNPNAALTREQAIAKLKEAKDLVDLGLMTQEDYDKLKAELTPIITGGN